MLGYVFVQSSTLFKLLGAKPKIVKRMSCMVTVSMNRGLRIELLSTYGLRVPALPWVTFLKKYT